MARRGATRLVDWRRAGASGARLVGADPQQRPRPRSVRRRLVVIVFCAGVAHSYSGVAYVCLLWLLGMPAARFSFFFRASFFVFVISFVGFRLIFEKKYRSYL